METKRKFAVVTGAAGGIGQAIVREFASAGYQVIATDRVPAPADLPAVEFVEIDLARTVNDDAYAREVFESIRVLLTGSGLAALVNNAAIQILGGVDSLTRNEWRTTLDVNLLAPFTWVQAFLPELEAAGGCVVNISSIHARLTKKNFVAYATSKAALSGMTRAMAVDLGRRVRVNAIEPAAIETEMLKAGFANDPDSYQKLLSCHPQGRIGLPSEIAAIARFLVQHETPFLHGACIGVDGAVASSLRDPL